MAALFTALARSIGIPTRITYGSFFKPALNGKDVDSDAHTWMEFYAPNVGWVPLDPALADLYSDDYPVTPASRKLLALATSDGTFGNFPEKRKYYFGHLDERRMTWSRGRDLTLNPKQNGGPVNHLFEAYLEVDGDVIPEGIGWDRKWTYREVH